MLARSNAEISCEFGQMPWKDMDAILDASVATAGAAAENPVTREILLTTQRQANCVRLMFYLTRASVPEKGSHGDIVSRHAVSFALT